MVTHSRVLPTDRTWEYERIRQNYIISKDLQTNAKELILSQKHFSSDKSNMSKLIIFFYKAFLILSLPNSDTLKIQAIYSNKFHQLSLDIHM